MTEKQEAQTKDERAMSRKPDGILIKKIRGKTFVSEIYFDKESKDTFQDRLLKIVQAERKEYRKKIIFVSIFSIIFLYVLINS